MQDSPFPILQFDPERIAVINPSMVKERQEPGFTMPERCVLTFFREVFEKYAYAPDSKLLTTLHWEAGPVEVYEATLLGQRIAIAHVGVGAPMAAGLMEELIALGANCFMACGGAGVLDAQIGMGHILLPTAAVRDEGLSYHYLPPAQEVEADPDIIASICAVLDEGGVPYRKIKTWTTDAFYRETRERVQKRQQMGCAAVDMECAAFLAVAKFRNVKFGQLLYGGDNLDCEEWDHRGWNQASMREKLFLTTAECCLRL